LLWLFWRWELASNFDPSDLSLPSS
jgi:hypothetical protein